MIHFIVGRSGYGKSGFIVREIEKMVESRVRGKSGVLLVPEQETVVWESKLARILPARANLCLEVTNFTRLANSVFRQYGGLADSVIDDGARILILWRAMLSVWDDLRFYNHLSGREDRNIPVLLSAIDELKQSGITVKKASEAADLMLADEQNGENVGQNVQGNRLSDRLSDVVLVYSAYNTLLHEEYIDKADLETRLAESLRIHPFFKGKTVYIDSFLSFTSGQVKIIREIFRQADEVFVTFMAPVENGQVPIEDEDGGADLTFFETEQCLRDMKILASRVGVEYDVVPLVENFRHKGKRGLGLAEKYLFDYTYSGDGAQKEDDKNESELSVFDREVSIISCGDKYGEGEACAMAAAGLLKRGYDFCDIAVAAGDVSRYDGIVDSSLRRHGFPVDMSKSTNATLNQTIKFIQCALAVGAGGWRREDIIRLVKTGLTNLSGNAELPDFAAEYFESYVNTWEISGRKSYTGSGWSMNPAGYKIGISEYGKKMLTIVNQAKETLVPPLNELLSVFDDGAAEIRRIAEKIVEYAEAVNLRKGLNRLASEQKKAGLMADGLKTESGWQVLCEILDKMVKFLGDSRCDCQRFLGLFSKVAAETDVGSIPSGINEIIMGNAQGIRFDGRKCIIILGSNDGEFPGSGGAVRSYFGKKEREILAEYGLVLDEGIGDLSAVREYCMYYRAVAAASDKLIVLCDSDRDESISEGARRLRQICGVNVVRMDELDESDAVYDKSSLERYLVRHGCEDVKEIAESICKTGENEPKIIENQHRAEEYTTGEQISLFLEDEEVLYLSQTKIETYVKCPFDYGCKYVLGIKPKAVGRITPPDIGSLMHRMLQEFFEKNPPEEYEMLMNNSEELDKRIDRILDNCKSELKENVGNLENRIEYLFVRMRKHLTLFVRKAIVELRSGEFKPVYFEKKIGRGGIPSIVVEAENGCSIVVEGIADRVDFAEVDGQEFVQIVDYKTGSKKFSLEKALQGVGIQLLVYLSSIVMSNKKYRPGRALYFSTNMTGVKVEPGESEDEVLSKAEEAIAVSGLVNSQFVENDKDNKKYDIIDENEFEAVFNDMNELIRIIGSKIMQKQFGASPREFDRVLPCNYCENAYICRRKRGGEANG